MRPSLAGKAATQGAVFSAQQARACGYTPREIQRLCRSGEWVTLRRGIYAESTFADTTDVAARHRLDVAAALLATGQRGAASHASAACLLDLEMLGPAALDVVRLTHPGGRASRSYPGLRITHAALPPHHVAEGEGLRTTTAARTVVDLARELTFREGVVIAESAMRRCGAAKADFEQVVRDCWTWPGIKQASSVVAFCDARCQAVSESLARVVFTEVGLPEPIPQFPVYDGQQLVGVADFGWPKFWTVGEIDGKVKYEPDARSDDDPMKVVWEEKRREDRIRAVGFEVVRFAVADLYHSRLVEASVRAAFSRGLRRAV